MNRKRLFTFLIVIVLSLGSVGGVAWAGLSYKSVNPPPFPDTCDIRGVSAWGWPPDPVFVDSEVKEDANCARLQLKMRWRNSSGVWTTYDSGWLWTSRIYKLEGSWASILDWTDHNGSNTGSGGYGFRIWHP